MTRDHASALQRVCSITRMTRLMRSQGVAGRARRSSPTLWARRFWLPIVNPPFHASFGRLLAHNSFEPYGVVATAIRVSPPDGEAILTHWFHEAKPKSEAYATEGRQEGIMKMLIGSLTLVLLLGTVPVVWAQADPAKEVADIGLKRGQAGARGDVDGVLADVADNVVITSARAGFRMEGKEAYRTFLTNLYQNYTNLYQNYPTRQGLTRQVTRRVFQEGNVVRGQRL
jgi:hypothetical protein